MTFAIPDFLTKLIPSVDLQVFTGLHKSSESSNYIGVRWTRTRVHAVPMFGLADCPRINLVPTPKCKTERSSNNDTEVPGLWGNRVSTGRIVSGPRDGQPHRHGHAGYRLQQLQSLRPRIGAKSGRGLHHRLPNNAHPRVGLSAAHYGFHWSLHCFCQWNVQRVGDPPSRTPIG